MWNAAVSQWCHASRPLPASFFFDDALRRRTRIGFAMRELNLSALALQAAPDGKVRPPFERRPGARGVSAALPVKSGSGGRGAAVVREAPEVMVCGPDGKLKYLPAKSVGPYPRGQWINGSRPKRKAAEK